MLSPNDDPFQVFLQTNGKRFLFVSDANNTNAKKKATSDALEDTIYDYIVGTQEFSSVQTALNISNEDSSGHWLYIRSNFYPLDKQHNDLSSLFIEASARNMELYTGMTDSTTDRTYIKTIRSEPTFSDAFFTFEIKSIDLPQFRNLYMKFQTVRPIGSTELNVSRLNIKLGSIPHHHNLARSVPRRSAAASGGAGGVQEVSAEDLLVKLNALQKGGSLMLSLMASPKTLNGNESIPPELRTPVSADSAGVLSASPALLLGQVSSMLDAKLSPIITKLDRLESIILRLEKVCDIAAKAAAP